MQLQFMWLAYAITLELDRPYDPFIWWNDAVVANVIKWFFCVLFTTGMRMHTQFWLGKWTFWHLTVFFSLSHTFFIELLCARTFFLVKMVMGTDNTYTRYVNNRSSLIHSESFFYGNSSIRVGALVYVRHSGVPQQMIHYAK